MAGISPVSTFSSKANPNSATIKTPSKKNVISIMDNLDGKSGFTKADVVKLGEMNKQERAKKLGLDASKYDVRVDSETGIVNIVEKGGESWLRREVSKTQKADNVGSTSRLTSKDGYLKINLIKNKDGSSTYIMPLWTSDGEETQAAYTVKDGRIVKVHFLGSGHFKVNANTYSVVPQTNLYSFESVITIDRNGKATEKCIEKANDVSTWECEYDKKGLEKLAAALMNGSFEDILNAEHGATFRTGRKISR